MTLHELKQFIDSNQFLQGGVALGITGGIIGGLMMFLKSIPHAMWSIIDRYLFLTLTYDRFYDGAYQWVNHYMSSVFAKKKQKNLVVTNHKDDDYIIGPGYGRYFFRMGWKFGYIDVRKKEGISTDVGNSIQSIITIKIFLGNSKDAEKIVEEGRRLANPSIDKLHLHTFTHGHWMEKKEINPVKTQNFIYPENFIEGLIERIKSFQGSREWYEKHNIPFRRTFMFHGSPGSGKSSAVKVLASALGMQIASLSLREIGSDKELLEAYSLLPSNTILILEDVDCFDNTHSRVKIKPKKVEKYSEGPLDPSIMANMMGVSLHGLLNVMDGLFSPEGGQITIMTTNHIEKLDHALIRPGRVDEIIEFKNPDASQFVRMGLKFYPDKEKELKSLSTHLKTMSSAAVQETFIRLYSDFNATQKEFRKLWK